MSNTKYILVISGIRKGKNGVGSVISSFNNYAIGKNHIDFFFPDLFKFSNNKIIFYLQNKLFLINKIISFIKVVLFIAYNLFLKKYQKIIIIHPQSIGYYNLKLIFKNSEINRNLEVVLYLMDNSFFCVKSYNYLNKKEISCLACVENKQKAILNNCRPFPNKNKNIFKLSKIIENYLKYEKFIFYVQNQKQFEILKSIYGFNFKYKIVGLWTDEYNLFNNEIDTKLNDSGFNIVYHGSAHEAKGFLWALELACNTPSLSFLFPINILNVPENYHNLKNCKFIDCQWETGLKYYCEQADAVIVPSLWSACIESALIKSLLIAKRVIVVENKTAYYNEIPIALYYEIKYNIEEASKQIQKVIENPVIDNITRKKWFADFKNFNSMVFDKLTE